MSTGMGTHPSDGGANEAAARAAGDDAGHDHGGRPGNGADRHGHGERAEAHRVAEIGIRVARDVRDVVAGSVEMASGNAREMVEEFGRIVGFAGGDGGGTTGRAGHDLERVSRCGTVLAGAWGDVSMDWLAMTHRQIGRNLEGMARIARSASLGEAAAIQGEIMRDGMEEMVRDLRGIGERATRAAERAAGALAPPRDGMPS